MQNTLALIENETKGNLSDGAERKIVKANEKQRQEDAKSATLSDVVGKFGCYQFLIILYSFVRYVCEAMMTNSGTLMAPDLEFWCQLPANHTIDEFSKPLNESASDYLKSKCQLEFKNHSIYDCSKWSFNTTLSGSTMTDYFQLNCDRDSLRSTFQGTISIGVLASVLWGSFSDRHGRNLATRICFISALIFGLISYFTSNFYVFTLARCLCTFSDAGLVLSLTTIVVETVDAKHRGHVCIFVYTGWSMGVMIMPWIVEFFRDYKQLMLFTVICHLFTMPWIWFTVGESIRWLLVNGRFDEAEREATRVCAWNRMDLDRAKYKQMSSKYHRIGENRRIKLQLQKGNWSKSKLLLVSVFGGLSKVKQLFLSRELTIITLAMAWVSFNGELLYMVTILINSDIGNNIKLNYAVGGLMEILASFAAGFMIASLSRKFSLVLTLFIVSAFCFALALFHQMPAVSIWILNVAKFAISTLTSTIYVIITEAYPTNLRQTGIGFTCLLGGSGAILGPFMRKELVDLIGMTWVIVILASVPLTAILVTILFIKETKGIELADDLDDIGPENSSDTHV